MTLHIGDRIRTTLTLEDTYGGGLIPVGSFGTITHCGYIRDNEVVEALFDSGQRARFDAFYCCVKVDTLPSLYKINAYDATHDGDEWCASPLGYDIISLPNLNEGLPAEAIYEIFEGKAVDISRARRDLSGSIFPKVITIYLKGGKKGCLSLDKVR